mgnify:CR=1 FL=1|jgi:hypothetical protein
MLCSEHSQIILSENKSLDFLFQKYEKWFAIRIEKNQLSVSFPNLKLQASMINLKNELPNNIRVNVKLIKVNL